MENTPPLAHKALRRGTVRGVHVPPSLNIQWSVFNKENMVLQGRNQNTDHVLTNQVPSAILIPLPPCKQMRQSDLAEKSLPTTLMVLLRWCSLSPQGPSGLAAILFPSPVKVSSIALFPTGAHPFSQCPDVVAYVQPPDIRPSWLTSSKHD